MAKLGQLWKVEAQGDVVYVQASCLSDAEAVIARIMGAECVALCGFDKVDALPEGEEVLNRSEVI